MYFETAKADSTEEREVVHNGPYRADVSLLTEGKAERFQDTNIITAWLARTCFGKQL
jgi:hypothetical protein